MYWTRKPSLRQSGGAPNMKSGSDTVLIGLKPGITLRNGWLFRGIAERTHHWWKVCMSHAYQIRTIFWTNRIIFLLTYLEYGAPDDLVSSTPKASKFVTLKLVNSNTNQATIKRVPRTITISTLQTLINKLLSTNFSSNKLPKLKYIDNDNRLEVLMDNLNKTLDYYSIQDGNSVIADWRWSGWATWVDRCAYA